MVIHDPEERPLIDEFGIAIAPATYTLAAITEVIYKKKDIKNLEIFLIQKYHYDYTTIINYFISDQNT